MIPLDRLKAQHQEIEELMTVLTLLMHDGNARTTRITRDLFRLLSEKLKEHITLEDGTLYKELLVHGDPEVQRVARNFLSGSHHLMRCLGDYMKRACTPESTDGECAAFVEETETVFSLIGQRIQAEESKFYPLAQGQSG